MGEGCEWFVFDLGYFLLEGYALGGDVVDLGGDQAGF